MSDKTERIILDVAYQPQVRTKTDTMRLMLDVIIALIPAAIVGVLQFGVYTLVLLLTGITLAASAVSEEDFYDHLKWEGDKVYYTEDDGSVFKGGWKEIHLSGVETFEDEDGTFGDAESDSFEDEDGTFEDAEAEGPNEEETDFFDEAE